MPRDKAQDIPSAPLTLRVQINKSPWNKRCGNFG